MHACHYCIEHADHSLIRCGFAWRSAVERLLAFRFGTGADVGVPSYDIAKVLQEEGGAIYTDGREVTFTRLQDIFKQEPILSLEYDTTENIESGFMERHEVPSFFSIDTAGAFVYGNRSKVRAIGYQFGRVIGGRLHAGHCLCLVGFSIHDCFDDCDDGQA